MKQIFIFLVVLLPFLAKSQTVIYGKYKYTDSLTFAKYKNNSTLDSVLSVDQNGRLRLAPASGLDTTSLSNRIDARVKYTDTSSMLIPYLRKLDTTGKWLAVGYLPYLVKYTDTAAFLSAYYNKTVIDSKLALKLNISDTAAMLSPYARTANLPSLAPYVKYTDTSTMLSPYYRTANATAALALKLNISDTATMLSSYYNKTTVDSKVNLKVNISDTLSMLSPYQRSFLAVKYTDTASMLSNYRTNINSLISDSVYQAAQILLRVRYTDTSTMLSPYARTLSLGGYVPYSGATNDLNIGTHNLYANNFFDGFTNIAASGTQIVLNTASTPSYTITGSGGQTIKLPDATTLPNGAIFYFNNNQTTGAITINNNSNTLIISIPSGGFAEVYLLDNSIAAGSWDRHFQAPSNVSWSTNTFDYAGSITSATWNGVAVAVNRGGTGASTSGGALTNLGAQPQLNGTGFVKASGTTISYDNSTYLTTSSASSTYLPLGGGTMTGNLILNADPTNSLGAVTKNYVDNAITGIFWKSAVKAATTGNITLLGAQTIDGVSIVANDRVLVKNQSTATQNGIYLASTTIWTRTTDADTGGEIYGSAVFVENGGSINGGTQWTNSNTSQPTIGVDNISFSQIAGAGVYTAGTYLSLTGNVFDVNSTYSSNWNNKINPSDTATMLTPYLHSVNYGLIKSSQTVSADSSLLSTKLWRQKGIDSVAALDALKVKYTDTAIMLSAYYNKTATDAKFNLKVNISDTASMLSPYLRSLNASATYLTQTTAASTYYLQTNPSGYITSSAITGKVNYTDTATMLSAYYNKTASDAKFNLKVNISDTASMLSGYKTYYPRAALSFTAGSGAYNNSTGVITIPTNTNQLTNGAGFISSYTETDPVVKAINGIVKSNGTTISAATAGTDYQAPISLTTTGSSGASTFSSNTLNVPNYTLSGLGGQPQLNGTGFVKATGTTISYDNSTYLTTSSASSTYLPLAGGTLTGSLAGTTATFTSGLKVTSGANVNLVPTAYGGNGFISFRNIADNAVRWNIYNYTNGGATYGSLNISDGGGTDRFVMSEGGASAFTNSVSALSFTAGTGTIGSIPSWMKILATDGTQSGVGSVYNNKAIYLYTSTSLLKLDAYDYAAGVALPFSVGSNGGNIYIGQDQVSRIGIGTTTTPYKLTVVGNGAGSGWASTLSNTGSTESVLSYLSHDGGYGMAVDATSNDATHYLLKLAGGNGGSGQGANVRFQVNSNGNVGIGTTSFNGGNLLQVQGRIDANLDQGAFRLWTSSGSFVGGIGTGAWVDGSNTTDIGIYSSNNLKLYSGGSATAKMAISSTGAITFINSISTNVDADNYFQLARGSGNYAFQLFRNYSSGIDILRAKLSDNATWHNYITMGEGNSSHASSTLIINEQGGNVGIGTISPRYRLDLVTPNVDNQSDYIALGVSNGPSGGGGTGYGGGLIWKVNYSGYTKGSAAILQTAENNYFRSGLAFFTNGTGDATTDWTEKMRITSGGYVGIGTISPSYALDVTGDIRATGNLVVSGTTFGGVTTQAYGYGHIYKGYTGSYYDVMFLNSGLAVDELQVSGGLNMVTTTAGFTVPNMTTTQKNALTKRKGMIVYDTTVNLLQAWNGSTWNNLW